MHSIAYQDSLECIEETQSSCIKQSIGSGDGVASMYSTATMLSLDAFFSDKCTSKGQRNNSPSTKKSKSTFRTDPLSSENLSK